MRDKTMPMKQENEVKEDKMKDEIVWKRRVKLRDEIIWKKKQV